MAVNVLDVLDAASSPAEAHSPLVVDANTELPSSTSFERLQAIARRYLQVIKSTGDLELPQLAAGRPLYVHESPHAEAACQCKSVGTLERSNHVRY
jgi:hypothetical protein